MTNDNDPTPYGQFSALRALMPEQVEEARSLVAPDVVLPIRRKVILEMLENGEGWVVRFDGRVRAYYPALQVQDDRSLILPPVLDPHFRYLGLVCFSMVWSIALAMLVTPQENGMWVVSAPSHFEDLSSAHMKYGFADLTSEFCSETMSPLLAMDPEFASYVAGLALDCVEKRVVETAGARGRTKVFIGEIHPEPPLFQPSGREFLQAVKDGHLSVIGAPDRKSYRFRVNADRTLSC